MKIGGHLSVAGGYTTALDRTIGIGGNTLQIFASSPRQWSTLTTDPENAKAFVKRKNELGIDPVYFHASYLVNMADAGFIGQKSRQRLLEELTLAEQMDIRGTIIHLGSYKDKITLPRHSGLSRISPVDPNGTDSGVVPPQNDEKYKVLLKNISWVLERANKTAFFIIEDAGNRKIGWSFDEIAHIVSDLKDDRVRVCIDTCHMFAAGYDISNKEKFDRFFSEFDAKIGLDKLEVFQVNDSKDTLGSFRDRHENIGVGNIPENVFRLLLNEPITRDIPFILEVPGVDKKGPNKENVDRLKSLIV